VSEAGAILSARFSSLTTNHVSATTNAVRSLGSPSVAAPWRQQPIREQAGGGQHDDRARGPWDSRLPRRSGSRSRWPRCQAHHVQLAAADNLLGLLGPLYISGHSSGQMTSRRWVGAAATRPTGTRRRSGVPAADRAVTIGCRIKPGRPELIGAPRTAVTRPAVYRRSPQADRYAGIGSAAARPRKRPSPGSCHVSSALGQRFLAVPVIATSLRSGASLAGASGRKV
jgi:hypothetical protein